MRLAQRSQEDASARPEDTDTVPDYSQYASSHTASKEKATVVFENSKFQSYTTLKGGAGLASTLRTDRHMGHPRGAYELVEELRQPAPRDGLERQHHLRKLQQSLHAETAGKQEQERSP